MSFNRPAPPESQGGTSKPRIGILHYSAPPTIGGVEMVMAHHTRLLQQAGYPVSLIAAAETDEPLTEPPCDPACRRECGTAAP